MMKSFRILGALTGVAVCSTTVLGATNFGAGYRETWGAYATGRTDTTYNSVWDAYQVFTGTAGDQSYVATADYPDIQSSPAISTPNSIRYEVKNRTLVNSLNDGITNGTTEAAELPVGKVLKPDPTVPLNTTRDGNNFDNLQIRNYIGFNAGSNRQHSGQYVELSYGEIHAPALTGGMDPLASAIPVLALGKMPGYAGTFTGSVGVNNTAVYFFNGQRWYQTGMATVAGTQGLVARIFYSGLGDTGWEAQIDYIFSSSPAGMGNTSNTYPLAFDPTVLGFDTVSWNMMNGGTNQAGPYYDDVWIAGGLVVPEPVTVSLLGLGGLLMLKRRRGA